MRGQLLKIDRELALRLLHYDPETGHLTWKVRRQGMKQEVGGRAGYVRPNGYRTISMAGTTLQAHRVIWVMVFGEQAPDDIDHENGDRDDNRLINLRSATRSQNCFNRPLAWNNTSGYRGVSQCSRSGKWIARIKKGDTTYHLGRHDRIEDAAAAYQAKAVALFGEFSDRVLGG